MGLVAVALENSPAFPTYPRRMNVSELTSGLVLPYAAQTIMGSGGSAAVLLLVRLIKVYSAEYYSNIDNDLLDVYGS